MSMGSGSLVNPTSVNKDGSKGSFAGTDYAGHAGGAIAGLFWGLGFFPRTNTEFGKKLKYIGIGLTVGYFVLLSALISQKPLQGGDN